MVVLDFEGVRARGVPYTRQHLSRLERDGRFPKRVILSADSNGAHRRVGWIAEEVDAWLADRIARRDAEAA
jgi:prophage regulatory protein